MSHTEVNETQIMGKLECDSQKLIYKFQFFFIIIITMFKPYTYGSSRLKKYSPGRMNLIGGVIAVYPFEFLAKH